MTQDFTAEQQQLAERIEALKSSLTQSLERLKSGFVSEAEKITHDDLYFKSVFIISFFVFLKKNSLELKIMEKLWK